MSTVLTESEIVAANSYKLKNINTSGEFKRKLEEHMLEKWDKNKLDKLFSMVSMGMTKFYDPKSSEKRVIKILCLGKVQSGKTAFFISSMAMAMDNGYNLFYVIGGTKNNLLSQNRTRIRDEFANNNLKVRIIDINSADVDEIKYNINNEVKVILMVLKNKNNKSNSNLPMLETFTKELSAVPSIIIDDEGDEYSQANEIDDNPYSNKKKVRSKPIHESIRRSIKNLSRGVFMSVTATPQSNLLVSTLNALSPDECILVEPGEGYTGANVFHGSLDNQFVVQVDDYEEFSEIVPKSFKEALEFFILCGGIKRCKNDNTPLSMLVHPSASINVQTTISNKIKSLLGSYKKIIPNEKDFAYDDVKEQFKKTFNKYENSFKESYSFDEVWEKVKQNLIHTKVFVVNGSELDDPKKADSIKNEEQFNLYRIYVGGVMLERGITLENLIVTYIYRQSKKYNADTLFQRARWFGYKEKYIDLCKIYMPSDLAESFVELNNHEVYLWNTIKKFLATNEPMQKMERLFDLNSDNLRLTRTSISKTVSLEKHLSGYTYDKAIDFTEEDRINNERIYIQFLNKHASDFDNRKEGNHINQYITVKFTDFYNEFLSKYRTPLSAKNLTNSIFSIYLEAIKQNLMRDECQIINMKKGEDISRSVKAGGNFIEELPQGYNVSKSSIYQGDRAVGNDKFSIQLHNIYTDNIDKKIVLLAINNPYDEMRLTYVTGDNYYGN